MTSRPITKPQNPYFSSGPCSKRPGYDIGQLDLSTLGRSHRSPIGKAALQRAIDETRSILKLPASYRLAIVPASDTGAMEMALWSLLGVRPVDVCAWEAFGYSWYTDISQQLKLEAKLINADYGQLPDLSQTDPDHDIVFTWNGTTSGVKVAHGNWISDQRQGLTLCDATSAVFAMELPWEKLDVTTFSWQKVLGGEGAHGMIILSPRAVERLESYQPSWPLPKIFRMTSATKLVEGLFEGATINTPSMLCVADYLDALSWAREQGGIEQLVATSLTSFQTIEKFVAERDWVSFLAKDPATRSNTSVCLSLALSDQQIKALVALLDSEGVAYDIGSYKEAPAGLRIWCGATVSPDDVTALLPWIEWAYYQVRDSCR